MGGGLMQLVAYGAQDIYLTGNPQITFFKVVYRRHTNFSMETIQQTINGASTTDGGSGTVTISRNGDLVHKVYVTSDGANIDNGDENVNEVELEIGGQRIDRHYKEWSQIWNELSTDESKAIGLKAMKGCVGVSGSSGATGVGLVQVPLNFWFCRNPGLALPLIALQYHEVKLKFTWGSATAVGTAAVTCQVWCDYIYLDTDERRRFAQVSHEYLIEQLQREEKTITDTTHKLNFNHPVKELIWTGDGYVNAQIKLNGHDRFAVQQEEYFQLRQPYEYHTAVPAQNLPSSADQSRTRTIVKSVDFTADSPNIDSGSMRIPANTLVTEVSVLVTTTLTFATATVGVSFGTQAGGTELTGSLNVDSLIGSNTTVSAGVGNSSGAELDAKLGGNEVTGFTASAGEFSSATDIHGRIKASTGAFTAGTVSFIVNYISTENNVQCRTSQLTNKINVYSFALKPEEHQPSGTCNFSRIDNAELKFNTASPTEAVTVYAVNYNVLRIMSGMGGLAYSN